MESCHYALHSTYQDQTKIYNCFHLTSKATQINRLDYTIIQLLSLKS